MGSEISAEELKEEEEVKEEPPKASESRHKTVFLSPEEAAEPSKVGWIIKFSNLDKFSKFKLTFTLSCWFTPSPPYCILISLRFSLESQKITHLGLSYQMGR